MASEDKRKEQNLINKLLKIQNIEKRCINFMKTSYLYFPQWQGAGSAYIIKSSADLIYNVLKGKFDFTHLNPDESEKSETKNQINNYSIILNNLNTAKNILNETKPDKIFSLGGDCGIEIAPVSYLNNIYENLGVIWFDAHGDLNTPESSPGKNFHGMPLRTLLGEGDKTILNLAYSELNPENVLLIGQRDLDEPEIKFIKDKNIKMIIPSDTQELTESIPKLLNPEKYKYLYIHLDLDVIDSDEFSTVYYPSRNGISYKKLVESLEFMSKTYEIAGGSLLEYCSLSGENLDRVIKLTDFWPELSR